jgi:uncharacterized membrane-anchored protein
MARNRPQVTYKGITPETQEAVRKAARAAGMTIGAWVEKTLLSSAKNVRDTSNTTEDNLSTRLKRVETMLAFIMDDYYERHPEARPHATPITHTGRIAAGLER